MYESIPKILPVAINPRTGDVFKPGDMIYRGGNCWVTQEGQETHTM